MIPAYVVIATTSQVSRQIDKTVASVVQKFGSRQLTNPSFEISLHFLPMSPIAIKKSNLGSSTDLITACIESFYKIF